MLQYHSQIKNIQGIITRSATRVHHTQPKSTDVRTALLWFHQIPTYSRNSSGRCNGSITSSFNVSFTFSNAPMSSNVTPISFGGITSARRFQDISQKIGFAISLEIINQYDA
ncbi:hypothetical protein RJ641_023680 [Dillenia turbinata]|uniref:Uncharacterized protein n=1 Tax=Dillenia turbinata TaxID=194707 RepID=A0AAN8UJG6_9MAGN